MSNHWQGFADFCRLDKLSGGPDSHMATIVHLAETLSQEQKTWLVGLYANVYNVPMALVLFEKFPFKESAKEMRPWIIDNWSNIVLRRERRKPMMNNPNRLADSIEDYARWSSSPSNLSASYDKLWASSESIRYFGRYAKMKLFEALRRVGTIEVMIPDLRAKGGWSPREGLSLLIPEEAPLLNDGGDSSGVVIKIDKLANEARARLLSDFDVSLNRYEFQVLICDYKQVAVTQRQYPGRSVDSELTYYDEVVKKFPLNQKMFEARKQLFPSWALAEVQGWKGVREELGSVFVKYNYMWSDQLYNYLETKSLANPVLR